MHHDLDTDSEEEPYGVRPPHGFVVLGDGERHQVEYSKLLSESVLGVAEQIRATRREIDKPIPVRQGPGVRDEGGVWAAAVVSLDHVVRVSFPREHLFNIPGNSCDSGTHHRGGPCPHSVGKSCELQRISFARTHRNRQV